MYPELFTIFGITIYTYGLMVAVGFFTGMTYIIKHTNNIPVKKDQMYDFLFYLIICSIIGARLLYVLVNIDFFIQHPADIIKVWQGGLVFYGGFITAILYAVLYCKYKKIDIKKLADVFAPALALGHAFGRIGCFFSGCCYGKETQCFISINNRYPTQIMEAVGNLIIFFVLHKLYKKSHKNGYIFLLYLVLYSVLRFLIEFLRGDDRGTFFLGLSPAQNISLVIFVIAIILLISSKENSDNLKKMADKNGK